ncbi:gamma-glutamyltransferase [Nitriliruptor alkaliphilus]|uniref:gamma-glutamyltransferase n=1 Tax=Nitriliruptor alkaliphilus TaxID=427918 RepID=UPI000698D0DB|nr:gamma-glutamyltransferase [Nitriliruptor alkaliphilus]
MSRLRNAAAASVVLLAVTTVPAHADRPAPSKDAVATGTGGAVVTVDPDATDAGLVMLRRGGNAFDAAVAASAALGVTEPYSGGIGGGGFLVAYVADLDEVIVIDGREEAPHDPAFDENVFVDNTADFTDAVNSGLSVGTPGTVATWQAALDAYGTKPLAQVLQPAITLAQRGFVVDETFAAQTRANLDRFRQVATTADLFLDDGEVPAVGSILRNPDLADTYRQLARGGVDAFYAGPIADDIVATVQDPQTTAGAADSWQPGLLTTDDLASYEVRRPEATTSTFLGYEIAGMPPPSSGGIAVGEILNILEHEDDLASLSPVEFEHRFLEASALAFADRNAYVADDRFVDVPQTGLLSEAFAGERWSLVDPLRAADKPVAPGDPCPHDDGPCTPAAGATSGASGSTTHLVTADAAGNVVSYTFTIEQTGGSALTVPGRGFILNNELTDFNRDGDSPNLAAPGKRPRSSMSPTIVLEDGEPIVAVGSPGGATIITTVAGILTHRLGRDASLPDAIAAPRAAPLNIPVVPAEPAYRSTFGEPLQALGHAFSDVAQIGAATGIELLGDGRMLGAAEPERRGGGHAAVLRPDRRS